jgi:hypothetical protein
MALLAAGQRQAAETSLRRALKDGANFPDGPLAQDALDKISKRDN